MSFHDSRTAGAHLTLTLLGIKGPIKFSKNFINVISFLGGCLEHKSAVQKGSNLDGTSVNAINTSTDISLKNRWATAKRAYLEAVGKKKILVVEDDTDIRIMMQYILRDDYDLVLCEDGRSGIDRALEEKPDLILLDIYMAGMSGFEVCKAIRDNPEISSIPIIIVTAGALKEEVTEGYSLGANDYVFKPFDPEDLIERIEKLL
jgi:CheY-like chemotaxis protein